MTAPVPPAEPNTPDAVFLRVEPGMRFGAPHINGVSAEAVAGPIAGGDPVEATGEDFGLTRPQVLLCCWFMAVYGTRLAEDPLWDAVWGPWLNEHYRAMASGDWGQVPDPPAFPAHTDKEAT